MLQNANFVGAYGDDSLDDELGGYVEELSYNGKKPPAVQ